MIDTHAHIYSTQYDNSHTIVENAIRAGVTKIVMPCIDCETVKPMLELQNAFPEVCFPMIGLHPCDVDEAYLDKLNQLKKFLSTHKFVAIGEIGLDFFHDLTFVNEQKIAFEMQLEWAVQYKLPINIHSRNANSETLNILNDFNNPTIKGIFHCFSGTLDEAQIIIGKGFYLGIGGVVTFKNSGLDKIVKDISLDYIVLETDAPFLAPVPYRGKLNQPSYLGLIAAKIAEIKACSIDEVILKTTQNAQKLFEI